MITELKDSDIGRRIYYRDPYSETQYGKLLSYDNEKQVAWVVYNCNEKRSYDHRKNFTPEMTVYSSLSFTT